MSQFSAGSEQATSIAVPAAPSDSRPSSVPAGTESARYWSSRPHQRWHGQASIIVPTRNEAENVGALLAALNEIASSTDFEVIFVDDSDDNTPDVIEQRAADQAFPVSYIHRIRGARDGGLGGAVVAGLRRARADWACVIDADLQHPPDVIPRLLRAGLETSVDVVIGTRYDDNGSVGAFGWHRELVSRVTGLVARLLFPHALSGVSDPMSGFFAVRVASIDLDGLKPRGFKILLEILARNSGLRVAEVGYTFRERHAGESNAGFDEGLRFLRLLWTLRTSTATARQFAGFAAVGLTGFAVNLLAAALLTEVGRLYYLASALLATQVSSTWNYMLTDSFVFSDGRAHSWLNGLVQFSLVNYAAFVLRGPLIWGFTEVAGFHYLVSTLISLAALTVIRFSASKSLIWKVA